MSTRPSIQFCMILALATSSLAVACGDSTGPSGAAATYALVRVAGDPLPTVLYSNEFGSVRVLADTIRLRGDGTGTISGVTEWSGVEPQGPTWGSADIRYRRLRSYIEIDYVCPPDADCAPPPHLIANEQGSALSVKWAPGMRGREPMIYQRVEDAP